MKVLLLGSTVNITWGTWCRNWKIVWLVQTFSDESVNQIVFTRHKKFVLLYKIIEYEPLLDSSNMSMKDWVKIGTDIKENYNSYDAFVILHGTDTLCYTSSALSFMLGDLGKTVVISGAQISIFEKRGDAKENFLSSLIFAGCYDIPEVCVCFGHKLFRGNRTIKYSSDILDAFQSPNYHNLGEVGIGFKGTDAWCLEGTFIEISFFSVFPDYFLPPPSNLELSFNTNFNPNVEVITFHPALTGKKIRGLLEQPTEGVILQSYGIGNIPSNNPSVLKALKEACDRGVIIVNKTQCANGTVGALYEPGRALKQMGIIPGYDMTLQAALVKLQFVLGMKHLSLDEKKDMMMRNLRGELSYNNQ